MKGSLLVIGHVFWRPLWIVLEGQVGILMEQVKRAIKQFGSKYS